MTISSRELAELQHEAGEYASDSAGPSFACYMAGNLAERIICDEYQAALRQRDLQLAWLYGQTREHGMADISQQRAWLARRNQCGDEDCVRQAYAQRIDELAALLGPIDPAFGATSAYFMRQSLPFGREFRSSPLYHKILPALVGDADTGAVIRREGNGQFSIAGKAVGANGHLCSVLASGLSFDPVSGWFSAPGDAGEEAIRVFQVIDQTLHIVRDGHPEFDRQAPFNPHVSCGMRASFDPMTHIASEPGELAAMMRFFEF